MQNQFQIGDSIWIETTNNNQITYYKSKIISLDFPNKLLQVSHNNSNTTVQFTKAFNTNSQQQTTFNDMVEMDILNKPEILSNIKSRYDQDIIYTYIGPTLIALNPYKQIQNEASILTSPTQPHIHSLTSQAYSNLINNRVNQSIIISGESGAGKTESAKNCMKYISLISKNKQQSYSGQKSIEEQILLCNPILEAFGNAKTVRNNNSSRFGKYVQIEIHKNSNIVLGAQIQKYMLEKSRVTHIQKGERNYHIFYFFLMNQKCHQYLQQMPFCDLEMFCYLNQSGIYTAQEDAVLCEEVINCFREISFSEEEIEIVFKLVGCVLFIGNIQAVQSEKECSFENQELLEYISTILQCDLELLTSSLKYKIRSIGKQTIFSPLSQQECLSQKNTLSRTIYDRLFSWIIGQLNNKIRPTQFQNIQNLQIGLLDIFGFENFDLNSLEQLLINYSNEHLQQIYVQYVFKNEQKLFIEDGLEKYLKNLDFVDNQQILDIIEGKGGVLKSLNDSCRIQNGNDKQFMQQLKNNFKDNLKENIIQFHKIKNYVFIIKHTQCDVVYNIHTFGEKNKDEVSVSIEKALLSCKNTIIQQIFSIDLQNKSVQTSKFLCEKFKNQIGELVEELNSSNAHFIRCIKPNDLKQKDCFNNSYVLQQIQYLGILESIEMRQKMYIFRQKYELFVKEYSILSTNQCENLPRNYKEQAKQIIEQNLPQYTDKDILFGDNRIYIKDIKELNGLKKAKIQTLMQEQRRLFYKICVNYFKFYLKKQLFLLKTIPLAYKKQLLLTKITNPLYYNQTISHLKYFFIQTNPKISQKSPSPQQKRHLQISDSKSINYLLESQDQEEIIQSNLSNSNQKSYYQSIIITEEDFQTQLQSIKSQEIQQNETINILNQYTSLSKYHSNVKEFEIFPPEEIESTKLHLIQVILDRNIDQYGDVGDNEDALDGEEEKFIEKEVLSEIMAFEFNEFFQGKLKKRTKNFFQVKSAKEILTFQTNMLTSGSLTILSQEESKKAMLIFQQLLLLIDKNTIETDQICTLIQQIIQLCLNSTIFLKDEVYIYIIKQINGNNDLLQILKILQFTAVFLYTFKPSYEIIISLLHFFFKIKNQFQKSSIFIYKLITFILNKLLKARTQKVKTKFFMPTLYQINAIIYLKKLLLPVFFTTGASYLINVDQSETINDLRQNLLQKVDVNLQRINEEFFGIFQVRKNSAQIEEILMIGSEFVWDLLSKWVQEQENVQNLYIFVLKIKYCYIFHPSDSISICLFYSQTYFDIFAGRIQINEEDFIQLASLYMIINNLNAPDLSQLYPSSYDFKGKEEITYKIIQKNHSQVQNFIKTPIQAKLEYISIVSKYDNYMSIHIQVIYFTDKKKEPVSLMLALKPTQLTFFTLDKKIYKKYTPDQIVKWGINYDKYFTFKTCKEQVTIESNQAYLIGWYISKSVEIKLEYLQEKKQNKTNDRISCFEI